jgi:hypothetical protein
MITITDNTTTVTLPADMLWADEFTWQPVEQKTEPTITGAIIVQVAARQAGRPITLQSGANYAWLTRAQLDTLKAWAAVPGQALTLTIRGVPRGVIFRHENGAIEADMVLYHAAPVAADYYVCTARFLET